MRMKLENGKRDRGTSWRGGAEQSRAEQRCWLYDKSWYGGSGKTKKRIGYQSYGYGPTGEIVDNPIVARANHSF